MDNRPSVVVNALRAERRVARFVVLADGSSRPTGLSLQLRNEVPAGAGDGPFVSHSLRWRTYDAGPDSFCWAKVEVGELQPATTYLAEVVPDGSDEVVATAVATTLAAPDAPIFNAVVGSCFEASTGGTVDAWVDAYEAVVGSFDDGPVQQVWLGDQVYVDVPWYRGLTYRNPRRTVAQRYHLAWGLRTGEPAPQNDRFAHSLRRGSNWFLSDDHEFWNGYPGNSWLTMFMPSMARLVRLALRSVSEDHEPHPTTEGRWGRAAGEAYAAVQTELDFDRFGSEHSPAQIQQIEYDRHRVLLVDTRWRRTILRRSQGSGFMGQQALDDLVDLLDTDQLVTLMLPKPIVGYPPKGPRRFMLEAGPENFVRQYEQLTEAIDRRARAKRPTIIVGGDVHFHAVRTAADHHVLEVVSSAMSMLDPKGPIVTPIRKALALFGRLTRRGKVKPLSFPRFAPDGSWTPEISGLAYLGRGVDGTPHTPLQSAAAGISVDVGDPARPTLRYRAEPLDPALERELGDRLDLLFAWSPDEGWQPS